MSDRSETISLDTTNVSYWRKSIRANMVFREIVDFDVPECMKRRLVNVVKLFNL